MGTRNLTMVKLNGKIRVAQYGQWDGYPTGQGENIAAFVQAYLVNPVTRLEFAERLASVKFATAKQLKAKFAKFEAFDARRKAGDYVAKYELAEEALYDRDTGSNILYILNHCYGHSSILGDVLLKNDRPFLKDTLFCEWAYCVNLDAEHVEVFQGTTRPVARIPFAEFTVVSMRDLEKELRGNDDVDAASDAA